MSPGGETVAGRYSLWRLLVGVLRLIEAAVRQPRRRLRRLEQETIWMVEVEGQDAVQVAVQLVTASWKDAHYLQRLCCRKIIEPQAYATSHFRPVLLLKSSLVVEEPPLSVTVK